MTQKVLFDLDAQYFICKQSAQLTEDQKLSQGLALLHLADTGHIKNVSC